MSGCDHRHGPGISTGCGPQVEISMPPHISSDWDANRKETATVTASKRVYKGDMVSLTRELDRDGEPLRVAYEGGKLLAATSNQIVDDQTPAIANAVAVWCFSQDGGLYLKAARRNLEGWNLGATVYAGELTPERAVLVYSRDPNASADAAKAGGRVTLIYEDEGCGVAQVYTLKGLALAKERDMVWSETYPANFAACWATCRSCWDGPVLNQIDGSSDLVNIAYQTEDGGIALICMDVAQGAVYGTVSMTAGVREVPRWPMGGPYKVRVAAPDGQEYLSSAWHLQCYRRRGTCWLTYPGADGKRYILEYTTCYTYDNEAQQNRREAVVYGCRPLILDGYTPCGGGTTNLDARETLQHTPSDNPVDGDLAEMPWLVGAISRTAGGMAQKALLGIERWMGGREHYLVPMGYLESNDSMATNIGLVSCCRCGPYKSAMAVGYQAEGKVRAMLAYDLGTEWRSPLLGYCMAAPLLAEPVCGPDVELATADDAMVLVEMGKAPALLYQRDGSIWLQALEIRDVAATVKHRHLADAVAVTGGSPGKTIKVTILRPQERKEGEEEDQGNVT